MGWGHLTPEKMLDSEDTAIVVVEGVIPPGAIEASDFDVRVFVLPGSTTSSLEGGRLYTADLRPGPLTAGSKQAFALATAGGPSSSIRSSSPDPPSVTRSTASVAEFSKADGRRTTCRSSCAWPPRVTRER